LSRGRPHDIRRQYQITNARGLAVKKTIPYQNLYVYEISGEISDSKTFIEEEADLVCANLHYQVIEGLIHQKSFFEKRWIILSGLFVKDAEKIERQLNQKGIQTFHKFQEKNWLTWLGMNRALIGHKGPGRGVLEA
jgi:ribosomal protein L11 methylase PrmA